MNENGLLHYLTIGPMGGSESPIHRLDPRTRLLGFAALLVALIAASHLVVALPLVGLVLLLVVLARVPLGHAMRGLRLFLPWLILVAAIQLLFGMGDRPDCAILVAWGPWHLTDCSLTFAGLTLTRFAGFVLLVGLLTWASSIPELARGLEALARPFDRLNVPAHQVALAGVIAMRFVPTMALEMERIQKAQLARGADLDGGRPNFVERVRRTLPLIIPLFVLALRRAERLAEAMEARAYSGGRGRGRYHQLRFRRADWVALGLMVLVLGVVVLAGIWMP
jgi:energy-coupling factor transport system permease protein